MVKFTKNNYYDAMEVAYLCIGEEYDNLSYEDFVKQLKKDRKSGRLEENGFKVDLRSKELIDILEYEEEE